MRIIRERHEKDPQSDKDACLASDEAGFVTGQTIAVNGGKTCW